MNSYASFPGIRQGIKDRQSYECIQCKVTFEVTYPTRLSAFLADIQCPVCHDSNVISEG